MSPDPGLVFFLLRVVLFALGLCVITIHLLQVMLWFRDDMALPKKDKASCKGIETIRGAPQSTAPFLLASYYLF